jgi:hypothetical protein
VRRNASGWLAGSMPRPRPLKKQGTPSASAAAASSSHAPSQYASLPTRNAGRSADATMAASRSTASASGAAPPVTPPRGTSPEAGPNRSSGKSRNTGPRCGSAAYRTCVVHEPAGRSGVGDGGGQLRDRRQHRHVVELLERARAPARGGGAPTEHHERRTVEHRRRDRRDAVGDARTGGQRRHARPAGELRVGLGGERRRLLVTGVDDAHAALASPLVQRPDVAAVEGEHHVDPELQHRRDGLLSGMPLDRLTRRLLSIGVRHAGSIAQPTPAQRPGGPARPLPVRAPGGGARDQGAATIQPRRCSSAAS